MSSKTMNSRKFAIFLGIATLTGTCFAGIDIDEAIAQSKIEKKAFLTDQNLNALINGPDAPRLAIEAKRNVRAFFTNHFYLVPEQIKLLDSFTAEDWNKIGTVLDQVAANKARATVQFSEARANAPQRGKMINRVDFVKRTESDDRHLSRGPINPNINFTFNITVNRAK